MVEKKIDFIPSIINNKRSESNSSDDEEIVEACVGVDEDVDDNDDEDVDDNDDEDVDDNDDENDDDDDDDVSLKIMAEKDIPLTNV